MRRERGATHREEDAWGSASADEGPQGPQEGCSTMRCGQLIRLDCSSGDCATSTTPPPLLPACRQSAAVDRPPKAVRSSEARLGSTSSPSIAPAAAAAANGAALVAVYLPRQVAAAALVQSLHAQHLPALVSHPYAWQPGCLQGCWGSTWRSCCPTRAAPSMCCRYCQPRPKRACWRWHACAGCCATPPCCCWQTRGSTYWTCAAAATCSATAASGQPFGACQTCGWQT